MEMEIQPACGDDRSGLDGSPAAEIVAAESVTVHRVL